MVLIEKELKFLGETVENAEKPFVAILGGAKISDKLAVIENLMTKVDRIERKVNPNDEKQENLCNQLIN